MLQPFRPKSSTYILSSILVVAVVLRLYAIDQPFIDAFSWRQGSTAMMAENFYRTNGNIFYPEVNWSGPGPNYQGREFQTVTYMAAIFYHILGQQDWIGRSIAVVFGLWGIFALYQLVRCVWDEPRALASAAVMAILPGSIFIERSFLPDPAMVALVTTGAWLLMRYLQRDQFSDLVWATVISTWGFLTKLPGLVIGLPMLYAILTTLHHQKWPIRRVRLLAIASICVLAPIIAYYLWAAHLARTYPPHHFAGGGNWIWDLGLKTLIEETYYLPKLFKRIQGWLWTPPVILLVGCGLLLPVAQKPAIENTKPVDKPIWLFHGWLLATVLLFLVGPREIVGNPWNLHLMNPAAAALSGHALVSLALWFQQTLHPRLMFLTHAATWWVGALLPLALFLAIGVYGRSRLPFLYYPYAGQSYQLGQALRQLSAPDELVTTMANALGDPIAIYYSQRRGWVFPPPWDGVSWGHPIIEDDEEAMQLFDQLRQQGARWLGIVGQQFAVLQQNNPQFMAHIERHSDRVQETEDLVIYRVHPLVSP